MEEWKECRLGDYCDFQNGYAFKSSEFKTNGEYKIVKIKELKDGLVKFFDDSASVDIQDIKEFEKYKIYQNDVLFALTGDPVSKPNPLSWVGRVSIYRNDENALLNQRTCKIKKSERIDNKFLYYYFRQWENFYALASKATGSASQANISTNTIADTIIKLPPLPTQQKIAAILSSLDDKIELNNKINTNLEQQSQALFKNWFVDFEPFGGKMPEGWKVGKLSDIAEIKTDTFKPEQNPDIQVEHYSLPAFDEKRYPTFEISKELKSNKFIISNDEVLVSKLNPTVKRVWRPYCLTEKSICSTEFIVYKPISAELKDYLFSIVNSSEFNDFMCSNVTGSTNSHQRTPPKTTLNYEIPIPTKEILHKFCSIVTPMYDKIKENIKQNETVSSLRDTLLPKLMNGEIEVDKVEL